MPPGKRGVCACAHNLTAGHDVGVGRSEVQERSGLDDDVLGGAASGVDDRVESGKVEQTDVTKLGNDRNRREGALCLRALAAPEGRRSRNRLEEARELRFAPAVRATRAGHPPGEDIHGDERARFGVEQRLDREIVEHAAVDENPRPVA